MQWLIDIIKDWIVAEGYLKSSYIDRGDPFITDFEAGDLTTDGQWHDLDLSAIVPAGAKAVVFRVYVMNTTAMSDFRMRKNGNSNAKNTSELYTQVGNIVYTADMIVSPDTNRIIEYTAFLFGWTTLSLTIKGWWL